MAGEPLVFVIEQRTGSDRKRIELADHDLPFGRPRKGAAFDLGGDVETNDVKLDGRTSPIIHTRYEDFHPTVVKGHLRDHFSGIQGAAHSTRRELERLKSRKGLVTLSIGKLTWVAFFKGAKFGYEGENDLTYELTFRVVEGPQSKAQTFTDPVVLAPVDLVANARAALAIDRAAFLAISLSRIAATQIFLAFDNLDSGLDQAESAARDLENDASTATASAMSARCQDAKAKCDALLAAAQAYAAADAVPRPTAAAMGAYQQQQANACQGALETRAALQRLQISSRQIVVRGKRLYRVVAGDTLESIAMDKLGSKARAGEIGYRQPDLKPDRFILIPAAS